MNQPFGCVYFVLSANSFHALGFSTWNSVIGISGQKLILLLKSIICSWALRAPGICLFKHSSHFQRGTTRYWQSKSMWAALKPVTTYFKIVLFLQPAGGKWGCETAIMSCRGHLQAPPLVLRTVQDQHLLVQFSWEWNEKRTSSCFASESHGQWPRVQRSYSCGRPVWVNYSRVDYGGSWWKRTLVTCALNETSLCCICQHSF